METLGVVLVMAAGLGIVALVPKLMPSDAGNELRIGTSWWGVRLSVIGTLFAALGAWHRARVVSYVAFAVVLLEMVVLVRLRRRSSEQGA